MILIVFLQLINFMMLTISYKFIYFGKFTFKKSLNIKDEYSKIKSKNIKIEFLE